MSDDGLPPTAQAWGPEQWKKALEASDRSLKAVELREVEALERIATALEALVQVEKHR